MKTWFLITLFVTAAGAIADNALFGNFEVVRVTSDGLLVKGDIEAPNGAAIIKPFVLLTGTPAKAEGDIFSADVADDGLYTFVDSKGESRTVHRYKLVKLLK